MLIDMPVKFAGCQDPRVVWSWDVSLCGEVWGEPTMGTRDQCTAVRSEIWVFVPILPHPGNTRLCSAPSLACLIAWKTNSSVPILNTYLHHQWRQQLLRIATDLISQRWRFYSTLNEINKPVEFGFMTQGLGFKRPCLQKSLEISFLI